MSTYSFHVNSSWRPRAGGPSGAEFAPADNRGKLSATTEVITFNCAGRDPGVEGAVEDRQRGIINCWGIVAIVSSRGWEAAASFLPPSARVKTIILVLFVRRYPRRKRCATPGTGLVLFTAAGKIISTTKSTGCNVLKFHAGKARKAWEIKKHVEGSKLKWKKYVTRKWKTAAFLFFLRSFFFHLCFSPFKIKTAEITLGVTYFSLCQNVSLARVRSCVTCKL